jgi:hypothetical protein
MITVKTLTNDHIRELRKNPALESLCYCAMHIGGDVGEAARARCVEIFNKRFGCSEEKAE